MWSNNGYGHSVILNMVPELTGSVDCALAEPLFDKKYHTLIPERDVWNRGTSGSRQYIDFYTDGSKLNNQVGLGVFSKDLNLNIARRLPDHCSVFQAEILAIKEVAEWLRYNVLTKVGINIFCDSQAAIKSLDSVFLNSTSALSCRRSLNEMAQQFDIHRIWVPGHRNIPGNCKADELARLGTTLRTPTNQVPVGMPLATCKLILRDRAIAIAQDRWVSVQGCVHSRQIWPKYNITRDEWEGSYTNLSIF